MTTLERSQTTDLEAGSTGPAGHASLRIVRAEDGAPGLIKAFAELWRYRELVISMALRELRVRYRQSTLGPLWALLQPLALMVLFSLFLGRFARMPDHGIPYPIFYYAALMPWSFAASALAGSANCLL